MRLGIPLENGAMAVHFGHSTQFALVDVDLEMQALQHIQVLDAPPHEPGVLPRWLASHSVDIVITGGLGRRATGLFQGNGIEVVVEAPQLPPEQLALDYMKGTLTRGINR